jgi:catechol 2,3-dioxygenase-like lactoylglutathione lyase family enzyme
MNAPQPFQLPPRDGLVVTHFLVVSDPDRSRDYYRDVFGAIVVRERGPVILQLANTSLILNSGGDPTDDKPTVTLTTPADPDTVSAFLNLRVADIERAHREWSARGARFLTDPSTTDTRSAPTCEILTDTSSRSGKRGALDTAMGVPCAMSHFAALFRP